MRKTKAIEELVLWLYLKGISTSDFPEALACLGHNGSGLSATTVVRMKEIWEKEFEDFSRRSLEGNLRQFRHGRPTGFISTSA